MVLTLRAVHLYFLSSPFCDPTSNNKQVEFQNNRHPEGWRILADRDSFEDRVKKISSGGIDYFVEGSKVSAPDANPVWVIRKQQRDIVGGTSQTKLTGTYFAFGERVYQAPSIADLVSSRLVSLRCHDTNAGETLTYHRLTHPLC